MQVATQYVDLDGDPTMNGAYNLNGSSYAIEGITSPDGRIFGKMGHSERYEEGLFKNIEGEKHSEYLQERCRLLQKIRGNSYGFTSIIAIYCWRNCD